MYGLATMVMLLKRFNLRQVRQVAELIVERTRVEGDGCKSDILKDEEDSSEDALAVDEDQ